MDFRAGSSPGVCTKGSLEPFLAIDGVLLVIADGSLSAWLTLLARLCDIALAIMNFFKGADWMKKVLVLVGKSVSGVPYAGPITR